MAIFSVLGIALISLLRQSTAFLEKGQAGSRMQDLLDEADRQLAEDFANVVITPTAREGTPDVRFLCDRVGHDVDGDGMKDVWTPRLSFVRSIQGEAADPVLRAAGSRPGAPESIDGRDDNLESLKRDHRAAGGKQEVAWFVVPGNPKLDADPGVMTVYRGTRAPVGGKNPLCPTVNLADARKDDEHAGIANSLQAQERLRPVMRGVLHLDFRFWSRHVRADQARLVVGGRLADEAQPQKGGGGLSPTWDSTRGILPAGVLPDQFFLGKGASPEAREAVLEDPIDDVFPSRVRVTLVVEPLGSDAKTAELAEPVSASDDAPTIHVEDTRFASGADPAGKFVKVGTEWFQWTEKTPRTFVVERRACRGTRKQSHPAGAKVRAGATLVREFVIPASREDWND